MVNRNFVGSGIGVSCYCFWFLNRLLLQGCADTVGQKFEDCSFFHLPIFFIAPLIGLSSGFGMALLSQPRFKKWLGGVFLLPLFIIIVAYFFFFRSWFFYS